MSSNPPTFNESSIEKILAKHHDYFLEKQLTLKGQQQAFRGKRIDLLFIDRFGDTLIVEIKIGVIKRIHVAQIIEYLGLRAESDTGRIRIMLVADQVPPNWKLALDRQAIEYTEITARDYTEYLKVKDPEMLVELMKTPPPIIIEQPPIVLNGVWSKIREFSLTKKGVPLSILNAKGGSEFTITEVVNDFLRVSVFSTPLTGKMFETVYDRLLSKGGWVDIGASHVSTRPDTVEGIIKTNFFQGKMNALSTATWVAAIMVQSGIGVIFNGKAKGQAIKVTH